MKVNSARVLVVDDEWMIRQQVSRALGAAGIDSDCAVDGEDALDKIVRHHYELVITDLRMPELHGHSLAVTLLSHPIRPKIVALTGVTEPRLTEDLLARGVDEVIYKPVNYDDLADRLKLMLSPPAVAPVPQCEFDENGGLRLATRRKGAINRSPQRLRDLLESQLIHSPPANTWMSIAMQWMEWDAISNPPIEIKDFLRRLSRPSPFGQERRREERVAMNAIAIAVALGDKCEPLGDPFKLTIRDLSRHGIGLVHTDPLDGCVALMWRTRRKARVIAVVNLIRCQRLDTFYEIGGQIVR